MIHFREVFVLIFLFAVISCSNSESCSLKYKNFPKNEAVLLWKPDILVKPENDAIKLNANDKINLACPGSRNFLDQTKTQITSATCVSGETLKIGTNQYLFSNLKCTTKVTGQCQETRRPCGASRGVIKNIGHNVDGKFLTLFDICYDNNNGEAIYADHVIFGSAINFANSVKDRLDFKKDCLTLILKDEAEKSYRSQLKTLTELLRSESLAKKYYYTNSYMAKGHLAPYADQVFVTSKYSTNFYINTVPQWQQINNGNWKSVELSIRKLASKTKEDIQVITGSWKVLQLNDINGNLVDIYLFEKLLPIPKFIWKIAYNLKTKKGIAFLSVNNPFINNTNSQDLYICPNICNSHNWGTSNWGTASKGLIYCCEIKELRKVVNTIPDLQVSGILDGK